MKNKKKVVAIAALLMLLAAYTVSDYMLSNNAASNVGSDDIPLHDGDVLVDSGEVKEEASVFETQRAELELQRNKILSASSDEQKEELTKYMEQEAASEAMIRSKGLPECFVVITEKSVDVSVDTKKLDQEMVTKITEIVLRTSGRSASEIVIHQASQID